VSFIVQNHSKQDTGTAVVTAAAVDAAAAAAAAAQQQPLLLLVVQSALAYSASPPFPRPFLAAIATIVRVRALRVQSTIFRRLGYPTSLAIGVNNESRWPPLSGSLKAFTVNLLVIKASNDVLGCPVYGKGTSKPRPQKPVPSRISPG